MKDRHNVAELACSGLYVSNKTDVGALRRAGPVEGRHSSKPDLNLPLIIRNMRLNFGGLSFNLRTVKSSCLDDTLKFIAVGLFGSWKEC